MTSYCKNETKKVDIFTRTKRIFKQKKKHDVKKTESNIKKKTK